MGDERFNSRTEDQPDQVHRCPARIPVSILSEPARNEPTISQDRDRSIPELGTGFWRGSVHRVESGERTPFPDREQQLLWNRHHWVESEFIITRCRNRSVW